MEHGNARKDLQKEQGLSLWREMRLPTEVSQVKWTNAVWFRHKRNEFTNVFRKETEKLEEKFSL
jgi:hypothetical protein